MTTPVDSLIYITDLHFWEIVRNPFTLMNKRFLGNANVIYRRRKEFHMAQGEPYSAHLASLGIGECLIGGDFTSTATHGEFQKGRAFVDGLVRHGMHVEILPGNHDVYTFESVRAKRFEAYLGPFMPEEGYPARRTLPGGTPLLLVPTACPNWLSSAGRITPGEVAATRDLLDACPDGPVLVAGHYPLLHRTPGYKSPPGRQLRNAEALRIALGETGRTILYAAGHVHRFSYTQDPDFPGLTHLTTAAFFLQRPGDACRGAFSVIHATKDGFDVEWHKHEDAWSRERLAVEPAPGPGGGSGR